MGLIVSYFGGNQLSSEPDPVTGISPKERSLVENSWILIKKDLTGNGVKLFLLYFKNHPEYQKLFPFQDVPYDELATNKKLKSHAANIAYALSAIVDNLSHTDVLIELLQKNGDSHKKRNISPKAYWDLKSTVLELLAQELGSKFTQETREAWEKTLNVAISVIVKQFQTSNDQ